MEFALIVNDLWVFTGHVIDKSNRDSVIENEGAVGMGRLTTADYPFGINREARNGMRSRNLAKVVEDLR